MMAITCQMIVKGSCFYNKMNNTKIFITLALFLFYLKNNILDIIKSDRKNKTFSLRDIKVFTDNIFIIYVLETETLETFVKTREEVDY